jgi:hypothetical protein
VICPAGNFSVQFARQKLLCRLAMLHFAALAIFRFLRQPDHAQV